nr:cache domain-containing protein [uncultured Rhodopila sp.]
MTQGAVHRRVPARTQPQPAPAVEPAAPIWQSHADAAQGTPRLAHRQDIIDIDVDPLAERSRRRGTLLRVALPVAGVSLIIGFLLGIAVYADSANRAGVLGLSDSLLHNLQDRIALQVSAYLQPAARAVLLAQSIIGRGGATAGAQQAYDFAASELAETPQIANIEFADAAGNFLLVRRGEAGATETKRILTAQNGRTVEWLTRDKAGHITDRHQDPNDDYDARTRSWYTGARAADDVFWSGVYVFFSERAPGITAAVHGPDENPDIVGVDIRLDALSRFLGGLAIGQSGKAYIVDKDGTMIAGPDPARILQTRDNQLVPASIGDIGDPDAAGSWDHYRAHGPGDRVIEAGGRRLISIVTPLSGSQGWLLLLTVPEAEFSGFVTANSRRAALLSLSVVTLAIGLAALLVRQGLKSDRAARAVQERSEALRQQGAAFARLAAESGQFDADGRPPPALAETLAAATGARRAGLWRLLGNGQTLRCEDSYEPATGGHVGGLELSGQEAPAFIQALLRGEEIAIPDAARDRRTAALHASLMASFGSAGLLVVPIRQAEQTVGMLMLEDSRREETAVDLVRACATLVALQIPPETPAPPRSRAAVAGTGPAPAPDDRGLDPALAAGESHGARAVVLALRLPDAVLAQPAETGSPDTLANRIACAAQEIAAAHGVPYVKMLGATIVCAAGYGEQPDGDAAARLADTAIALRERCAALFDPIDDAAPFGIGLDAGAATGATLGSPPGLFNLWGEAAQGAEALAASAPDGGIQASEQAYRLLRQGFLFRPRGLFHRPRTGETRSFILAGRA